VDRHEPVGTLKLSDAEWTVMRAVWKRSPATARDVLEHAEGETGWAYTTVKTLLARLVEKGALSMRMRGNVSLYEPRVTMRQARVAALRALVDRAFDGTFGTLLQHLIAEEKLSARDRATLSRLIADVDREDRRR
jgi:BlaI family transcriptional regulator, penicillinase repressor